MAGPELASYFQNLARYNTIVNERLYMACSELSDDEYRRERAASFNSIHATLNHILLADRIWMDRFTQRESSGPRRLELFFTMNSIPFEPRGPRRTNVSSSS